MRLSFSTKSTNFCVVILYCVSSLSFVFSWVESVQDAFFHVGLFCGWCSGTIRRKAEAGEQFCVGHYQDQNEANQQMHHAD